jgi:uncharacterized damage-inducible protein DinB
MRKGRLQLIIEQYKLIQESRHIVLNYCADLPPTDFVKEIEHFGRGSIRNTLVHIANVYEFWIGKFSLGTVKVFTEINEVKTAQEIRALISNIDVMVETFLEKYKLCINDPIIGVVPVLKTQKEYSALTLITHVITHEFHHKGQVMTMGRILGYTPPDADVIHS